MKKLRIILVFCSLLMGCDSLLLPSFIPQPSQPIPNQIPFFNRNNFKTKFTVIRHYNTVPLGHWLLSRPGIILGTAAVITAGIIGMRYWIWYKNLKEDETLAEKLENYTTPLIGVNANQCTGFKKAIVSASIWKESTDFISWLLNRRQKLEDQALCTLFDEDLATIDTNNNSTDPNVQQLQQQQQIIPEPNRPWKIDISGEKIIIESKHIPPSIDKKIKYFFGFGNIEYIGSTKENPSCQSKKNAYTNLKKICAAWAQNQDNLFGKIQSIEVNKFINPTIQVEKLYKLSHSTSAGDRHDFTTMNTIKETGKTKITITPAIKIYCIDPNAIKNIVNKTSSIKYQRGNGYTIMEAIAAGCSVDLLSWIIASLFDFRKTTR